MCSHEYPPSGIAAIKWQTGQARPAALERANKTIKTGRKQHQIDCETWRDNANGRNGNRQKRDETKEGHQNKARKPTARDFLDDMHDNGHILTSFWACKCR